MMFQEELNVSQTFSVLTGEYICHNEKMWALCTEVLDPDDVYPKFMPTAVVEKLKNICLYQFVDSDKFIRKSMSKFIHVSYKDGQLLKASTNTKIPLTFAFIDTAESRVEWQKLTSILGLEIIHLEKISKMFDLVSPTDIFIDHIFLDLDGNVTGISCNPNRLNTEYLKDTDYGRIANGYQIDKKDTTFLDFDINTDGSLNMYPEITYNSRNIAFPHDTRYDDSVSPIGYTLREGFKPVSNRLRNTQIRENLITQLRDGLNLINDDQATWLFDLCDHDDQKLHISYKFHEDGSLKDILVHRVEVENFEVWRA